MFLKHTREAFFFKLLNSVAVFNDLTSRKKNYISLLVCMWHRVDLIKNSQVFNHDHNINDKCTCSFFSYDCMLKNVT